MTGSTVPQHITRLSRRLRGSSYALATTVFALLSCAAPATGNPDFQTTTHSDSSAAVVGFWAGEEVDTPQGPQSPEQDNYYAPTYQGALTPAAWAVLANEHVPLYLNIRYGRDFGPVPAGVRSTAADLVRHANRLNVPIIAWIVVPVEQGDWANEANAGQMFDAVRDWASWKDDERIQFEALALDQEFSWQDLPTYVENVSAADTAPLAAWMRSNIDPTAQCNALRTYEQLIVWAHSRGISVTTAEAPMIADDLSDGDLALQDGLNIAGSTPGYDQRYLMAYRSAVTQAGTDPGSGYPASYYTDMNQYFGPAGQVSLGIGGQAPYDDLTTLTRDIRMLAGLGAKRIPIYSLETTVDKFGAPGLQQIVEAARDPLSGTALDQAAHPTPISEAARQSGRQLDRAATALTLEKTEQQGHLQSPNTWPPRCR